ncbi:MAG TPA: saccharopine dehydrogenase C-terminal domain-containing protein [Chitinophagaceae bacterium]|nr:saccharopine dehydrogenase C-terminal domain-containing protein [Chitinophagaceae bacterium]
MKQILLFGAGKSATVLIDYLLENAASANWELTVIDSNLELAKSKIHNSPYAFAFSFDIMDAAKRGDQISKADIVISMLPPSLHFLVAKDCVKYSKHLLTASYADEQIKTLEKEITGKNLLFLCEMGLDPGIDHMSAMKIIDEIHAKGGKVISFKSHCGGLVAPESDDNPWHYKISWNPRNIVLAGKAGAHYREGGKEVKLEYAELFSGEHFVEVPGTGYFGWYPNRDSLSYISLYGLENADTFIRTTLRHIDFMYGWKNVIDLNLTDETPAYETDGRTLAGIFKEHLDKNNFGEWLHQKMSSRLEETQTMLENLSKLAEAEQEANEGGAEVPESFMAADAKGNLEEIEIDDMKTKAAAFVAHKMHEANLTLKQLIFLGLDDTETIVNKGLCSAADILQFAMEKKISLKPEDKDMIVMMHEIEYEVGGQKSEVRSSLVIKGENSLRTAMAKTVGLPLGIAAKLILSEQIESRGLCIPTVREIYEPVLQELERYDIRFHEQRNDQS